MENIYCTSKTLVKPIKSELRSALEMDKKIHRRSREVEVVKDSYLYYIYYSNFVQSFVLYLKEQACIQSFYSIRNLTIDHDIEAIHPSQRKMMKRQRTGIRPMAAGTQHAGFSLRAETNLYLKRALQMGKSLITVST